MHPFVAWNSRLLQEFFSEASQGQRVWLSVTAEDLNEIAPDLGGDLGLRSAVRAAAPWPSAMAFADSQPGEIADYNYALGFVDQIRELVRQRSNPTLRPQGYVDPATIAGEYDGSRAPTYLPILAVLVRAAAEADEAGYYAALKQCLPLSRDFGSLEMSQVNGAWRDLEAWTSETDGRFGVFEAQQLGGYRHVGVPRSQSIMSRQDALALTRLFVGCGLRAEQALPDATVIEIAAVASHAPYLSAAFREAASKAAFRDAVHSRIRATFDEWDGLPRIPDTAGAHSRRADQAGGSVLEVCLGLRPGMALPWEVRWKVSTSADAGEVKLTFEGTSFRARLRGREFATTVPSASASQSDAARLLLAQSAIHDVVFDVSVLGWGGEEQKSANVAVLQKRAIRTFGLWQDDDVVPEQACLVERPIPAHGAVYFLACESSVPALDRFFVRNDIAHATHRDESGRAPGLPDGWVLYSVADAATIGEAARREFPDGLPAQVLPRAVRLVGGSTIQRGVMRQFLMYDLPSIELDAPSTAVLRVDGLALEERRRPVGFSASTGVALQTTADASASVRIFDVVAGVSGAHAYRIAAMLDGVEIGHVWLRVAATGGVQTGVGLFRLGPRGERASRDDGLLGVLHPVRADASEYKAPEFRVRLGWEPAAHRIAEFTKLPAVLFLDALAQRTSMPYGVARDLLRRLLPPAQDAPGILRDLRSRGFLEIEADGKGHWVCVHSVPPLLVLLPVVGMDGCRIAAITGSLRLAHWRKVLDLDGSGGAAYSDFSVSSAHIPPVRVATSRVEGLRRLTDACGLTFAPSQGAAIAAWSAGLSEARSETLGRGVESIGAGSEGVQRFIANSAEFHFSSSGVSLTPGPTFQLFRMPDNDTRRHQLFVLGHRADDGRARYSFVADSKWGIWIALSSFAEFVRAHYAVEDASPWPFPYARFSRTLWLPARINLPTTLERALVLCSGADPMRERFYGTMREDCLVLSRTADGRTMATVSKVFSGMVPADPSWATWLGYQWVPPEVAALVADRLGGQVREITDD